MAASRISARTVRGSLVLLGIGLLGGCGGRQSALDPAGPGARRIAGLWWGFFAISVVVFVVVMFFVLWALVLRRGPDVTPRPGGDRAVVLAGVVVPVLVLVGVYGAGLHVMTEQRTTGHKAAFAIDVIGHDWWWEVRYPDQRIVTANEIHIPVGRPVTVRLATKDVIHSFWVPSLQSKTDLVPGKSNETWLLADHAGRFRGQCAEYCGLQHAGMGFVVIADPPAVFDAWVAQESGDRTAPTTASAQRGEQVFESQSCASCHTIRGTTAGGTLGPDLTHFGSRSTLGAGVAPNDRGWLGGWIANSQTVKPGNLMPPQPLDPQELRSLLDYLEGLK